MDPRSLYPWEDRPLLGLGRHPLTADLIDVNAPVVVGHGCGLEWVPLEGVSGAAVLSTSRRGWLERGTERPAVYQPESDGEGPVDVALALEISAPHPLARTGVGRVVVVGDLDWAGDPLIDEGPGNRSFAAAMMRWLMRDDVRQTRVAAPRQLRRMVITGDQLSTVRIAIVGGWPLFILCLGLVVRWRRARP
jgi:hypothetical protein